jgi:SAM-dependent methyltransferase
MKTINTIRGGWPYYCDLKTFKNQKRFSENIFPFGKLYPCLGDRFSESGTVKGHYFHQDLLVARRIFENNPELHIDVGSRIDGFVAHVASFRPIKVLDIRLMTSNIQNITYDYCDITNDLPEQLFECCDSLSCLHALEHFGLGRYGDPVNCDGHVIGFENLYKMLRPEGKFYFSVPIGPRRIEFNAQRVFSLEYLLQFFSSKFQIDFFSFVDDKGNLFEDVELKEKDIEQNFGCHCGCGVFEMTKMILP